MTSTGSLVHYLQCVAPEGPNDCVIYRYRTNRVSDGNEKVFVVANASQKVIHLFGEVSADALVGVRPMKSVGERKPCGADDPQAMVVRVDIDVSERSHDFEACTDSRRRMVR